MGHFTVTAALFILAAMAAIAVAQAGRALDERIWKPVGTRVVNPGNWPYDLDSLQLGDPDFSGAGGPAASASAGDDNVAESSGGSARERFGDLGINVYEKIPLFGP
uniref:Uncharacterized protein n=1 Tax=Leersia perrieri TaxID=77586 RepID=A0A0D9WGW1_9ORYZ